MTERIFNKVTKWQEETFKSMTVLSVLTHLAGKSPSGEILELIEDIIIDSPNKKSEWADCFILLFGAAKKDGMSYADICQCVDDKMNVNKKRKWGVPDKNGVVFHIKENGE